jgi:hypothetical protein
MNLARRNQSIQYSTAATSQSEMKVKMKVCRHAKSPAFFCVVVIEVGSLAARSMDVQNAGMAAHIQLTTHSF